MKNVTEKTFKGCFRGQQPFSSEISSRIWAPEDGEKIFETDSNLYRRLFGSPIFDAQKSHQIFPQEIRNKEEKPEKRKTEMQRFSGSRKTRF
jgi:hypothetical protein